MDGMSAAAHFIAGAEGLRRQYAPPTENVRRKALTRLDPHCRRFIALSPFLCLGTCGPDGADVSPRGDPPGFVLVLDDRTLLIPDRPGNNRIDSLSNLVANPQIGILFIIPGIDETLRVNGVARITSDPALLARAAVNGRPPASALLVEVREAFLHCAKALMRSRLWHDDYKVERRTLPSLGKMFADQLQGFTAEQADTAINRDYAERLY